MKIPRGWVLVRVAPALLMAAALAATHSSNEAVNAYLERRAPVYTGR